MDQSAVQRLIHSLISSEELEPESAPEGIDEATETEQNEIATDANQNISGTDAETADESDQDTMPDSQAASKQVVYEAESSEEYLGEPTAPPTEGLIISQAELNFMGKVAPLMPRTPRSVKRFVNIYKLYKAALSTQGLSRFLGTREEPGNFRAVQVLLALVTGAPRFAQEIFQKLNNFENIVSETADKRLSYFVGTLNTSIGTPQTTLDALKEFARGENDLELADLKRVAPLVSRYSVHHMLSDSPGESGLR